jgi:hypothetical protein
MRSIDEVIGNEDALRRLRSAVAAQEALLARIRAMLPGELAPHCVGATVDGHTLRLLADSAAWATRLRYLGRDLIRRLRADAIAVSAVEVRLLPSDARAEPVRRRTARPSDSAAVCLEQTADGIGDPALRAALQRLGRRLRR